MPKDASHFKREREKFIERTLQVSNIFVKFLPIVDSAVTLLYDSKS